MNLASRNLVPTEREPARAVLEPFRAVVGNGHGDAASAVVTHLPWPQPLRPGQVRWEEFARFPNFWEGHILGGLLENEGIPVIIESLWPGVDLASYSVVWVPQELAHRARWVVAWPPPSEDELIFLATGELPSPRDNEGGPG